MARDGLTSERYPHAPIVEAALSLRLETGDEWEIAEIAREFAASSPSAEVDTWVYEVSNELIPVDNLDMELEAGQRRAGFEANVGDHERLGLVDGRVSYIRSYDAISKYDDWEAFIAGALEWSRKLIALAGGRKVVEVGVRFVNHLPIPAEQGHYEITDYVRMSVQVPGTLPQSLARMFLQIDVPFEDEGARVRCTVFAGLRVGVPVLVLDIDARKEVPSMRVDELHGALSDLRSVKNQVFEASITDASRFRMRQEDSL